ncbi:chemotaxis protein CheX [Edaphobacter modestus]|uniref:CheY-specific phosphatase CheX n=1 Tax=Edaphobacter modestus TaxID=388466 RepID=A0A4Q7YMY0_9BACT|nr:chemotaxis protein CheX [Edaphobacter modestus]RZU39092.1 CheY-specific phosphatase CheX [Edaphobacter modestus]
MVQLTVPPVDANAASDLVTAVTDTAVLDKTVEEVLGLMMGVPVNISETPVPPSNIPVTLTAVIGLAGALSGVFTVVVNEAGAKQITACMMGMEVSTVDDTVLDGLGEIANILAGAWKSKIPALSAACLLSVPTVVTGTHYEIHKKTSTFQLARSYRFQDSILTITLYGEYS